MPNQQPIPPLEVFVRKRDKVVYQGQATAISSVNTKGPFDILPEHANFITVIKEILTIHKPDKTEQKIEIKNGVLYSADNKVAIYLDTLSITPDAATKTPKNPNPNTPNYPKTNI